MRIFTKIFASIIAASMVALLFSGCQVLKSFDLEALKPGNESEPEAEPIKKIMTIEQFDNIEGLIEQYDFYYNDNGQITDIYLRMFSSYESYDYHTKVEYNPQGQIIFVTSGEVFGYAPGKNSGQMYTYNEKGQLIEMRTWEGGVVITEYTYDDSGRCIYTKEDADFLVTETEYDFTEGKNPERARRIKSGNTYSEEEMITYSYDEQGRLVKEVSRDEDGNELTLTYDYTYAPFVLVKSECYDYPGSNLAYLRLQADSGKKLLDIYFYEAKAVEGEDGYIKTLKTEDGEFRFHFDTDRLQIVRTPEEKQ